MDPTNTSEDPITADPESIDELPGLQLTIDSMGSGKAMALRDSMDLPKVAPKDESEEESDGTDSITSEEDVDDGDLVEPTATEKDAGSSERVIYVGRLIGESESFILPGQEDVFLKEEKDIRKDVHDSKPSGWEGSGWEEDTDEPKSGGKDVVIEDEEITDDLDEIDDGGEDILEAGAEMHADDAPSEVKEEDSMATWDEWIIKNFTIAFTGDRTFYSFKNKLASVTVGSAESYAFLRIGGRSLAMPRQDVGFKVIVKALGKSSSHDIGTDFHVRVEVHWQTIELFTTNIHIDMHVNKVHAEQQLCEQFTQLLFKIYAPPSTK